MCVCVNFVVRALSFHPLFSIYIFFSGDALFHHGNTLHHSAPNTSDRRRWAFMSCFNKADNSPVIDNHYPKYTPLKKVVSCLNSPIR